VTKSFQSITAVHHQPCGRLKVESCLISNVFRNVVWYCLTRINLDNICVTGVYNHNKDDLCLFASMVPLLIKDHLMSASLALVVIFYLVADLSLSATVSNSSVNVDGADSSSRKSTFHLHANRILSLMVCHLMYSILYTVVNGNVAV